MCLKVDDLEKYRYQPLVHYKYGTELFVITRRLLLVIFCLAVLPSCSNLAGPPYERPDVPTKKAWSETTDVTVSADEIIRPDWWTNFRDPYLNGLVKQAIDKNIDLRILAARIEVARAALQQEETGLLPTLGVNSQASLTRGRDEFGLESTRTDFSLTGQLNWEIDVWGKLEKGVQAQQAEYKATAADWRAGYLTLISDVASTYFLIRQLDEQISQQQQGLSKNQQILAIFEAQYREGLVAKTAVLQQKAEVSNLQGQLVELRRQRKLAENRLATLMGIPAGELRVPVAGLRDTVKLVEVPAGLPSDLLSRRPDIMAAEYRVLQAYELTGEARLARLPSLSLTGTGSGSLVSNALSSLVKTWSFGLAPSINIPIFDPSLKANVKVREAQTRVAAEEYRQTVIKAFEEVENVLVNLSHRKEQKKDLEQQLENLRIANEQIRAQLREGLVSQLEVFESERTLLSTELELLQIHQQILSDTVTLYKALGGGWPKENIALSDQ